MKTIKLVVVILGLYFSCGSGEKVRVVDLTNAWTLQNQNNSIRCAVKVPSSVYSAVSSLYGEILHSKNDVALRWVAYENWTYVTAFFNDNTNTGMVNLTLHGIDTVATVRLNGRVLGTTNNMFVRYSYEVLPYMQDINTLEIEIMSPVLAAKQAADAMLAKNLTSPPYCVDDDRTRTLGECHRNMLRKMQASFGNDWNLAAPSLGIWKAVSLEYYEVAIMRDIDVAVQRNDTHWTLDVRVFLSTGIKRNFYGNLTFYAADLLESPLEVSSPMISYAFPTIEFKVAIPEGQVQMWWPNGYGVQKLYPLYFSMNCWVDGDGPKMRDKSISQKYLKIGFRTLELIEDDDDIGRTFYFKVNGHPIFVKGAVYLPSHILPEQSNDQERISHILKSAKDSHMNMIRVWGGGLYESDYFYSLADQYGLLVWQDMAFTTSTYPITEQFVEAVRLETQQNAKRIAYHPSLALIATNDEIELYLVRNRSDFGQDYPRLNEEYKQLFMGTIRHVLNIISRNAYSPRPGPIISTPSNGVDESKKELPADPQNINCGDVHFWKEEMDSWDPDIYPRARFISEYGFQSLPMLASWARSMGSNDSLVDLIKHRQRDPKGFAPLLEQIERHLPFKAEDWEKNVEAFIYFSQLAQAQAVKTATEVFRSQRIRYRTMGAIYWHLNDVWVAPSWSSIDFYGNYKLLHYWSQNFLAPTSIIALYDAKQKAINVTLTRDDITEHRDMRIYDVTVNVYLWSELLTKRTITRRTLLNSNEAQLIILPMDSMLFAPYTENNSFLEFVLSESDPDTQMDTILCSTFYFPCTISKTSGIADPELVMEISEPFCVADVFGNYKVSYSLTIRIKHPALFVNIEILHPKVEKYKLSHNGFVQVHPVKSVHLEFHHSSECVVVKSNNIKVLTVNQFMVNDSGESVKSTSATLATMATTEDVT